MHKRLLICSVIGSLLIGGDAFAATAYKGDMGAMMTTPVSMFRPYIGVNYIYIHQNLTNSVTETVGPVTTTFNPSSTSPNNFSGVMLNTGFRYGHYYGMEFGYYETEQKSKTTGNATVKLQPLGGFIDVRGYLPIQNWDIFALAGFSINSLGDSSFSSPASSYTIRTDNTVVPRVGLGVDYNFTNNWGIRAEGKYGFPQSNYVNNTTTFDAGIYYTLD